MTKQPLCPALTAACCQLWTTVFDDLPAYADFYFRSRATAGNTFFAEREGRVVSQMQSLRYRIRIQDHRLAAGYVSGLATHPSHRGEGLASLVLSESHQALFRSGAVLSFLIPSGAEAARFYAKRGYEVCMWHRRQAVPLSALPPTDSSLCVTPVVRFSKEHLAFLLSALSDRTACVLHSQKDLREVLHVAQMSGGGALALHRNGGPLLGLLLYELEENGVRVLDVLGPMAAEAPLLRALCERYGREGRRVWVERPAQTGAEAYGMVRVVNVYKLLQHYAALNPKVDRMFSVCDEELPQNTGCYVVKNGRCTKQSVLPNAPIVPLSELAAQCVGRYAPAMTLMLD